MYNPGFLKRRLTLKTDATQQNHPSGLAHQQNRAESNGPENNNRSGAFVTPLLTPPDPIVDISPVRFSSFFHLLSTAPRKAVPQRLTGSRQRASATPPPPCSAGASAALERLRRRRCRAVFDRDPSLFKSTARRHCLFTPMRELRSPALRTTYFFATSPPPGCLLRLCLLLGVVRPLLASHARPSHYSDTKPAQRRRRYRKWRGRKRAPAG